MPRYRRLTINEREEISLGLAQGRSRRDIATMLGRSPATVSREILRNSYHYYDYNHYRAAKSQRRAERFARKPRRKRKLDTNERLRQFVFEHLDKRWTPEQIANTLKKLYPMDIDMHISHEAIYQYLYVWPWGELRKIVLKSLRRRHKYRRKYGNGKSRRQHDAIQDFISIEQRPKEAADRIIPGHWEGDLLMGHNNASALGVLVERTTRMIFLVQLKDKDATTVRLAFGRKFKHLPEGLKRSLTYDNGQEMAQHKLFTKNTNIQVYFAHPHSPWERGTAENSNDILRQFFPKGIDFNKVSLREINKVQELVNDRPRKTLGFSSPHEVFAKLLH